MKKLIAVISAMALVACVAEEPTPPAASDAVAVDTSAADDCPRADGGPCK